MKRLYLFTFLLLIPLVLSGCIFSGKNKTSKKVFQDVEIASQEELDVNVAPEGEGHEAVLNQPLVNRAIDRLPEDYIVNANYEEWHSFEDAPFEGVAVYPCNFVEDNPLAEPLCYTKLSFWKEPGTFSSIVAAQKEIPDFEGKESETGKTEDGVVYAKINTQELCFQAAKETCVRDRYAFHFSDGSVIRADISYWLFDNSVSVQEPIDDVAEVKRIFEKVILE